jgi:hypothetical protein
VPSSDGDSVDEEGTVAMGIGVGDGVIEHKPHDASQIPAYGHEVQK